jgi:hypothetical protein
MRKPKKPHMKTGKVKVRFHFWGKHLEIRLTVPPDMEERLYKRLGKRLKKT